MVRAHDGDDWIGKSHSFQNLGAHQGVDLHLLELFGTEASRLGDDVLGHSEFANVMQQGRGMQGLEFRPVNAQMLGNFDGIDAHALQMFVGGVILGLDGAQVQVCHLLHVPLLIFQLAQVQPVRAVDQVNGGQDQERCFPIEGVIQPYDDGGDSGSDQVIGERPEVAIDQDAGEWPSLGKRNYGRDCACVGDEINGRSKA